MSLVALSELVSELFIRMQHTANGREVGLNYVNYECSQRLLHQVLHYH